MSNYTFIGDFNNQIKARDNYISLMEKAYKDACYELSINHKSIKMTDREWEDKFKR